MFLFSFAFCANQEEINSTYYRISEKLREVRVKSQRHIEIWDLLLDAEMNEIYWSGEAQRFGRQDRLFAAAGAIVSSGTVLALFGAYPITSKVVACVSSVISILHATLFHTGRLKMSTGIAARWREIAVDCQCLWGEVEKGEEIDGKSWREFQSIARRRKSIDESQFEIHDGRLATASIKVRKARGLPID